MPQSLSAVFIHPVFSPKNADLFRATRSHASLRTRTSTAALLYLRSEAGDTLLHAEALDPVMGLALNDSRNPAKGARAVCGWITTSTWSAGGFGIS